MSDQNPGTPIFLRVAFSSMAGTVVGIVAVVLLGLLEMEFVRGTSGVALGALLGSVFGASLSAALNRGDRLSRVIGGLSGFVGGSSGAFCTIASAEIWQGLAWAFLGGIYGAFVGALMGGLTAVLSALCARVLLAAVRSASVGHNR